MPPVDPKECAIRFTVNTRRARLIGNQRHLAKEFAGAQRSQRAVVLFIRCCHSDAEETMCYHIKSVRGLVLPEDAVTTTQLQGRRQTGEPAQSATT